MSPLDPSAIKGLPSGAKPVTIGVPAASIITYERIVPGTGRTKSPGERGVKNPKAEARGDGVGMMDAGDETVADGDLLRDGEEVTEGDLLGVCEGGGDDDADEVGVGLGVGLAAPVRIAGPV